MLKESLWAQIITSDHLIATVTLDAIIALVIPLVALLMLLPVIWHEKHIQNIGALQTVHLSNLVTLQVSAFWWSKLPLSSGLKLVRPG
jgi:hypothetical protein